MKPRSILVASIFLASAFATASALASANNFCSNAILTSFQQGPGRGPITVPRDPELEKQSYRHLEVAKFYFYKRKPDKHDKDGWERLNKAVESRLQEVIDTNPNFARIDDVFFMLGEVYNRMGDLDKAVENWTKAANETSDEKIKSEAQKRLNEAKNKDQKKG